ncbi:serine hydrolase [Paenibacillus sp. FSL H7-0357]|uniref:serine hydrolase n=1 Tax=Paenibacillus sp. FSL H7-0357 TaxID=1536774 RepID=UPI0006911BCA|nr:serine hydrolase [Paenibacillus sp. FSL H7-0357]
MEQTINFDQVGNMTDDFMKSIIGKENGIPGGAVVMVQEGRTILQKGYGYADLANKKPVDPENTLFRIGSVTKTFTAAAIMQLVDSGKLDLHADITGILGEVKLDNPYNKPVTVHHLLTHTSGFESVVESEEDFRSDLSAHLSLKDYLMSKPVQVVREPGSAYMYDNHAYNLLGYIIERVSGLSYDDYMEKHLLADLGMTNSFAVLREAQLPNLAVGYEANQTVVAPYLMGPSASPSGGMLMTPENMAHFLKAQLANGQYDGKTIWSEASLEPMLHYQVAIHPAMPDTSYGYENWLRPKETQGQHLIMKGGDVPGYSSFIILSPDQQMGVAVFLNQMEGSAFVAREWANLFMEHVFGKEEQQNFKPDSRQNLKYLEGNYTDLRVYIVSWQVEATGDGEITVTDTSQRQGGGIILKQIDRLMFEDANGEILVFKETADGSVSHLKYTNPVAYAEKRPGRFADLQETSVYKKDIERLAALGLVKGHANDKYAPLRPVTKAEWTVMLTRMLGLDKVPAEPVVYKDVVGNWSEPEVSVALAMGLVEPDSAASFGVNRVLNRIEAAEYLVKAVRQAGPHLLSEAIEQAAGKVRLKQEPAGIQTKEAVKLLVAAGLPGPDITRGADGTIDFRGTDHFIRQEMALWIIHFQKLYF